jgi:hypothetical protein
MYNSSPRFHLSTLTEWDQVPNKNQKYGTEPILCLYASFFKRTLGLQHLHGWRCGVGTWYEIAPGPWKSNKLEEFPPSILKCVHRKEVGVTAMSEFVFKKLIF